MRGSKLLLVLAIPVILAGVALAQSSSQLVFSTTDTPSFTPGQNYAGVFTYTSLTAPNDAFGFWIWCETDSTNRYSGACNGAMYFYGIALTKGVSGRVTELSEGMYQMTVSSADGKVACTLTNSPPITAAHTNTVTVQCSSPAGTGVANQTVVTSTGR